MQAQGTVRHWGIGNEGDSITAPDGQEEGPAGREESEQQKRLPGRTHIWRTQHRHMEESTEVRLTPLSLSLPHLYCLRWQNPGGELWVGSGGSKLIRIQPPRSLKNKAGQVDKTSKTLDGEPGCLVPSVPLLTLDTTSSVRPRKETKLDSSFHGLSVFTSVPLIQKIIQMQKLNNSRDVLDLVDNTRATKMITKL